MKFLLIALLLATSARGADIKRLIADLANPQFAVRERATKELIALGETAAPFLQEATRSDDPEVRLRAREIMARLKQGGVAAVNPALLEEVEKLLAPVTTVDHRNVPQLVAGGARLVPALIVVAKRTDDRMSVYAGIVLTRIADPSSFAALADLFQVPHIAKHLTAPKDPHLLFHLIRVWQEQGDKATPQLRAQVALISGEKLGDDPDVWMQWYLKHHSQESPR